MRLVRCCLALIGLLLAASGSAGDKPDFSGDWTLDTEKSQLQVTAAFHSTDGVVHIEHHEPQFHYQRTFTLIGKQDTTTYDQTTDGKMIERVEKGHSLRSRLYWDGDALVYVTSTGVVMGKATDTMRYSLQDGGRTLRADEQFRGPVVKYDNVWIFERSGSAPPPAAAATPVDAQAQPDGPE